jgi:pyruvate,water dikinase
MKARGTDRMPFAASRQAVIRHVASAAASVLLALTAACEPPATEPDAADVGQPGPADCGPPRFSSEEIAAPPPALRSFADEAAFEAFAGPGQAVKFLVPAGPSTPGEAGDDLPPLPAALLEGCSFQDPSRYVLHIDYLQSLPGLEALTFDEYTALALASGRRLWAGTLTRWPTVAHPVSGARPLWTYEPSVEEGWQNVPSVQELGQLDAALSACLGPSLAASLALLVTHPDLAALTALLPESLKSLGVDVVSPQDVSVGADAVGLSLGVAVGRLRVLGAEVEAEHLRADEIVVSPYAPNDIGMVAGLVTAGPQSPHSHANVRLLEDGIPNAWVPGIYDDSRVLALDGQWVELVVAASAVSVTAATPDAIARARAKHSPEPMVAATDLTRREIVRFEQLGALDSDAYGGKAALLGELTRALPVDNRVAGFGIPVVWYEEHFVASRAAALLDQLDLDGDREALERGLEGVRDAIKAHPLDPALLAAVREAAGGLGLPLESTRLKFRSSANVEDLPGMRTAGLYDSKGGCFGDESGDTGPSRCRSAEELDTLRAQVTALKAERAAQKAKKDSSPEGDDDWRADLLENYEGDLTEARPVDAAIRKVWASLWTVRAYEARAFRGVVQRSARMALAVNPSFVLERANAVAVSNLGAGDVVVNRLVSQVGALSVVEPERPDTVAETIVFGRAESSDGALSPEVLVRSSEVGPGQTVLTEAQLDAAVRLVFQAQDHFHQLSCDRSVRLELELKLTRDGRLVAKQVDYWGPGGP